MKQDRYARLRAPFPADDIEWRAGSTTPKTAILLPYITARAIMDRLDEVIGPENWFSFYKEAVIPGGLECRISIWTADKEWITKCDAAEPTAVEAVKGGYSSALKRAAVLWGIGRYLYSLPLYRQRIQSGWGPSSGAVQIYKGGKHLGHCLIPSLPHWALPKSTNAGLEPFRGSLPWFKAEVVKTEKLETLGFEGLCSLSLERGWGHPSTWSTEQRLRFFVALDKGDIDVS